MKQQSGGSILELIVMLTVGAIMIAIVYNLFFSMNDKEKNDTINVFRGTEIINISK